MKRRPALSVRQRSLSVRQRWWLCLLLVAAVAALPGAGEVAGAEEVAAAQGGEGEDKGDERAAATVIDSNHLAVVRGEEGNRFVFSGKVHIRSEGFEARCDRMEVHTAQAVEGVRGPDPAGFGSIRLIEATGSVEIEQGTRRATAERALIFPREEKVILEGDPVLRDGRGVVRGYRMILYGEDGRIAVEPGPAGEQPRVELPSVEELRPADDS